MPDSALIRSDTYIVAKDNYCIEEQDQRDGERESYVSENEGPAEFQDEISLSQNKLVQNSIKTQRHKCQNSKNHVCDATFVIDAHEVHLSPRQQGSSNAYNKPISVVQPIISLGAESLVKKTPVSKEDSLLNEETNNDSECNTDLVKAVLCSRNKIALALAAITPTKQLRSSQVCSKEATGQTPGKLLTGKKSCDSFMNKIEESKPKDRRESKATVSRGSAFEQDNKMGKILDSEKCQPLSPCTDGPHPFVRRHSVKITPACLEHKAKSPPRTLKLENCNFDKLRLSAAPEKRRRRSATLCMLSGSGKSDRRVTNLEGFSVDSLTSSPGSKAFSVLSSHLTTPSVQCHVSPSPPLKSPKKVRRRSSQILPVNEGAMSADSKLTAKKKGKCLEYQQDPLRKFQASKGVFHEKGNEFSENVKQKLKATYGSRDSLQDTKAAESSPKKDVREKSCKNRVVRSNSNSQPFFFTEEKLNGLLGCHKPVLDKVNSWKTKGEFSPVSMKNRRDSCRDNCSKTIVDAGNSNFGLSSVEEKDCKEKRESYLSETKNREDQILSCRKTKVGVLIADSGGTAVPSQKKSCSDHGCFMFNARRTDVKGGIVHEMNDGGELNCKRKVAGKSRPLGIYAKEGLTVPLTVQLPGKKDLKLKELRTPKSCVSSPSGNTKSRIVLCGNLESNSLPQGSHMRKRRARESVATDTQDSLPRKQAKRGSPMSSSFEHGLSAFLGSESLSRQTRESTPVKGKNFQRVRVEGCSPQNMKLLSPIRRPVVETCDSVRDALLSPCKRLGSCDKFFCFDCC